MLIIDIETKPEERLRPLFKSLNPALTEDEVSKAMAVSTDFAEIVCIGIKQIDGETRVLESVKELNTKAWYNLFNQMPFITFNGKRFSIPLLIKQGKKNKINLPYSRLSEACKKWGYADRHYDLLERLSFNNKFENFDTYTKIYLNKVKNKKEKLSKILLLEELFLFFEDSL